VLTKGEGTQSCGVWRERTETWAERIRESWEKKKLLKDKAKGF